MDAGPAHQTGAHAEPAGRVMVSGDHHRGYADGGEPVQRPVEELDGGQRRHGPVVHITCHHDGVDLAFAHSRHQMIETVGLRLEQGGPVERPPQVPVRCVQNPQDLAPTCMFCFLRTQRPRLPCPGAAPDRRGTARTPPTTLTPLFP